MRVAHVTCLYVPEHRGGAPQQCHLLAVGQHESGHQVSVFTGVLALGSPMLQARTSVQDGLPVTRVVTTEAFRDDDVRNWRHPALEPIFERFLEEQRPEVVHFHSIQSLGASLVGIAKKRGASVVVTMHDLWWICERQFCIDLTFKPCIPVVAPGSCACMRGSDKLAERRAYLEGLLEDVDLILAPSASLVERLRMSGIRGRIEVDPNSVRPPVTRRRELTAPGAPSGDRPLRILYAGGEARQKGIHVLAEALRILRAQGVTAETDAYGVEPFSIGTTSLLKGTGVQAHHAFEPWAIDEVMAAHEVLVVPSVMYESSSRAVREALVRGLAVIATEVGGPEEVIEHGVNGLLVPADDSAALAAALRRLHEDRPLLSRLAAAGPLGPVPTPEQQVTHVDELYASLVPGRPPRPTRPPAPKRVLFVAGIDGSPLHYRVHQKVEQLAIHGVKSVLLRYSDPGLGRELDNVDAVIIYRAPATRELVRFIREVHRRGLPIRFDVDDLIFDPELAEHLPTIAHLPKEERDLWVEGVKRYRETLRECGAGIASTPEIAKQMGHLGIPARIHRNGVDTPIAVVSERARRAHGSRFRQAGDPFVLGYSSGTTTHDADLALVGEVLRDFLLRHPEARLVLGGPLRPPPALDRVAGQIERLPFIGWERHPDRLCTFDLNLAPLIEGLFNESKSSIKWSEASLVDVPTLASASAPFRESVRHGETGLLASDLDAWRARLEEAIGDRERLGRIGRRARLEAYAQGSPWVLGENLLDILAERVPEREGVHDGGDPDRWPSEVQLSALEPAGLLPGLKSSIEEKQRAPGPLLRDHRVAFELPPDAGPVSRVDILHATFLKPAGAPVCLALRSRGGTELSRTELQPEKIGDNGWAAFQFDPPVERAATVELWSNQESEAAPYIRPEGTHLVDGKRRAGGIVARTFHQPPIPPDFGPRANVSRPAQPSRWAARSALAAIVVRRGAYIIKTEGPVRGGRRIAGGVRRRLRLPLRFVR